ncbi:MAG: mechanosensitive ion channel family protein [Oscillospiraceae bacterium]
MKALSGFLEYSIGGFTVSRLLSALVVLMICLIATKVLMRFAGRAIDRTRVEKTLHVFIKSSLKILLLFLTAIITLGMLGIPVTSLIAVFSVAGLAVSLAIQGVLSNLAGGIQILLAKPFLAGDYIDVNGIGGTATEIGLTHTKLTTPDNKIIFVPNSSITASQIINYSGNATRRIDVCINVPYESTCCDIKALLISAAESTDGVLQEPKPFSAISKFGDSSIEYLLRIWVATDDYWNTFYELNNRIKTEFDRTGIQMACNNMNIHMIEHRQCNEGKAHL